MIEPGSPEWNARAQEVVNENVRLIKKYGWVGHGIFGDSETSNWFYTSGLTLSGSPELVMVGLPAETAQSIIGQFADRIVSGLDDEWRPAPGPESRAFGRGMVGWWIEVDAGAHQEDYPLSMAAGIAGVRRTDVRALQLVMPDSENRLPWQDGFDAHQMRSQVLLGSAPTVPSTTDTEEK